jgi:uncharacterized protein YbjT (DUF2867 family)
MIVVTTPTGNIGSKLVEQLLAAKQSVRVITRDPARLSPEVRERVEVVSGSSDAPAVLDRALAGAESLFHVVPPFFGAPNVTEYYLAFTRPVCAAMKRQHVSRVVTVSGIGRRADVTAGVVTSSLMKDIEFERAGFHVRALWCPGFMENMLRNVESIRTHGIFFGMSRGDVKSPFVATRDIAASALRLLLDRSWTGPGGLAVLGPEDVSQLDVAAITSEVLGRPVRYERISAQAHKAQLLKYGASEDFAQGLVEMHQAKDDGLDSTEPRTAETTTPTTYRQWCREVLARAVAAAGAQSPKSE